MTTNAVIGVERTTFDTTADYRRLVSPLLFERLTSRIVKDEEMDRQTAERVTESALGFLYLIATTPNAKFAPSELVDIGWHTFILYTRDYAQFCRTIAGRFIHHAPNDDPNSPMEPGGIRRSIEAIRAAGLPLDEMLWTGRLTARKAAKVLAGNCDQGVCDGTCGAGSNCGDVEAIKLSADCDSGSGPCSLGNCTCS